MIDIGQIVSINICSENDASLWEIKNRIAVATQNLGPDDLFLVGDFCCRGAAEGTGYMLNSKLCRKTKEFIKLVKVNFNAVGSTDVDCPKRVIIITEEVDDLLRREIVKMDNINYYRNYECQIHIFVIGGKEETVASTHSILKIRHSTLDSLSAQLTEVFNGESN